MPVATVRRLDGVPSLFVDEAPYPPLAYMSCLGEERYYREAALAGIHLYCSPAYLGDRGINSGSGIGPFRRGIWRSETEFDFSSIRASHKYGEKSLGNEPSGLRERMLEEETGGPL